MRQVRGGTALQLHRHVSRLTGSSGLISHFEGIGTGGFTVVLTVITTGSSYLITRFFFQYSNVILEPAGEMAAILAPLLITPPITYTMTRLLLKISKLEREMREMATFDALTSVYNKGSFMLILEKEFELALRNRSDYSILFIDVDHFKRINDTFGHLVGDEVLRYMATLLKDSIRSGDIVGRFGGEEFVIALPLTKAKDAYTLAERIRQAVSLEELEVFGQKIRITVSCGLSSYGENSVVNDVALLLEDADAALYLSKNEGRNRTRYGVFCLENN